MGNCSAKNNLKIREKTKKLRSESHTFLKSHTHLSKRSYYRKEREDGEKKKSSAKSFKKDFPESRATRCQIGKAPK